VSDVLDQLVLALKPYGLNHYGVVSVHAYDQQAPSALRSQCLAPGSKSIAVFASGGTALWESFVADIRENVDHFRSEKHPLDAFVDRGLNAASQSLGGHPHRWFTASAQAEVHLDFRTLAIRAGIGSPSRLGLVIHPVYGPWLGLRAACFLPDVLDPTPMFADLCDGCAAPCVSACPGEAFIDGAWDVGICASFHREASVCARRCDARVACPVGEDQRYSALQRHYHYDRKSGRIALAQHVGIEGDNHVGVGPDWSNWADSSTGVDPAGD
jgi:ferredoxin